jgi:hypothetical protein
MIIVECNSRGCHITVTRTFTDVIRQRINQTCFGTRKANKNSYVASQRYWKTSVKSPRKQVKVQEDPPTEITIDWSRKFLSDEICTSREAFTKPPPPQTGL